VDYQIQVWDVNTLTEASENGTPETPEYVDRVEEGEWFSSWLAAADEVSRTIAKRLARDYFRDASHFQNL
jgi:hypothetical protein